VINTILSLSSVPIYPAQGILTLISQAWNLLKINLKSSLLIVSGPALLLTLLHFLISTLSSQNFLTPATGDTLTMKLLVAILVVLLAIPSFCIWIFSACALSRLYYSGIIHSKSFTPKECWLYIRKAWPILSLLIIVLSIMLVVMLVLDFLVLFLSISLSALVIGALSISSGSLSTMGPGLMLFFFLMVLGFLVLAFTIGLGTFQGFFFMFPLIAIATDMSHPILWKKKLKEAYLLLFKNFPRLIVFALALFCFSAVLTTVLLSPVWLWAILEMTRLGISQQHYIPLHIQSVLNISSSLANLVILPFHMSALTLLWYDCQVRSEGLDLLIWFNNLICRYGKHPSTFGTALEPKSI
jgi:hypothetical protein